MNPYTLDFSKYGDDILEALFEVYGDEYLSVIQKRFNLIYFVPYVNYEGINAYYRFLLDCKSKELSLKMLKIIGIDVDKYGVTNYADSFSDELREICEKIIGGSYSFKNIFRDTAYGFKSFISKYCDGYSEDYILEQKVNFINAVKSSNYEQVTIENFDDFSTTLEYKRIEALATYYSGVYDTLIEYMDEYEHSISKYEEYYRKEIDRKREKFKTKKNKLYYVLEDGLKGNVKRYIDSLDTEEAKIKALLSGELEYSSDIEYFSDENENKLNNPETEEFYKNIIFTGRMKFFKSMGAFIDPWQDKYEEVIKRDDIKELIVNPAFANEVTRLRKYYLEEGQKEFLLESEAYQKACTYFANNQTNRDAVYRILSNVQVCVNGGYNDKQNFLPIIYYTIRSWQCGCMDYVVLHEIVHAIECVSKKNREHGCGFEPNVDNPELSNNGHYENKRKYERLNEVITDFLAIETCEVLHKKGIYLLDEKKLTLTDVDDFNTSKILKDLVRDFYKKFRKIILTARLSGDIYRLTDYIGVENFEEFNDLIDKVDVLIEKGLADKLRNNQDDDPLALEYHQLSIRIKELYIRMIESYDERENSYYGDYSYKKRKRKWI